MTQFNRSLAFWAWLGSARARTATPTATQARAGRISHVKAQTPAAIAMALRLIYAQRKLIAWRGGGRPS
jgi:hypothetical protein